MEATCVSNVIVFYIFFFFGFQERVWNNIIVEYFFYHNFVFVILFIFHIYRSLFCIYFCYMDSYRSLFSLLFCSSFNIHFVLLVFLLFPFIPFFFCLPMGVFREGRSGGWSSLTFACRPMLGVLANLCPA